MGAFVLFWVTILAIVFFVLDTLFKGLGQIINEININFA